MAKAVFGITDTIEQTETIVDRLRVVGFTGDDISVLFPDRSGTKDFAHEKDTKAPEGTVAGVGTGGAVGGVLGYLAGIGALTIPGVGPLIAAGPIMAALSGAAVGGAVGGITGALVGMGIPEYEAKRYAGKVESGSILISAHAKDREQVRVAKAIFEDAGASDISTAGEVSRSTKDTEKERETSARPSEGQRERAGTHSDRGAEAGTHTPERRRSGGRRRGDRALERQSESAPPPP